MASGRTTPARRRALTVAARNDRSLITTIIASLSAIPEQERQRLSHASRLKLDGAEVDLRRLLKTLAKPG